MSELLYISNPFFGQNLKRTSWSYQMVFMTAYKLQWLNYCENGVRAMIVVLKIERWKVLMVCMSIFIHQGW